MDVSVVCLTNYPVSALSNKVGGGIGSFWSDNQTCNLQNKKREF
jgi:hypothetical protein